MKLKVIPITIILLTLILAANTQIQPAQSTPEETKLYPSPQKITANPGENFTVEIIIENVRYLYTFEFWLSWQTSVLNVTSVVEGPFLSRDGAYTTTFYRFIIYDKGFMRVLGSLHGEPPGNSATGTGTIAIITFIVNNNGGTPLDLYNTNLIDAYTGKTIPHEVIDGYFQNPITKLYIDPPMIIDPTLKPSSTFQINITLENAINLYALKLNLSWQTSVLNVTSVVEGPFLSRDGAYTTTFESLIFEEEGNLFLNTTLAGDPKPPAAEGNGTIATITFLVAHEGVSDLHLYDTSLTDPNGFEIYYTVEDGYFNPLPTVKVEPPSIVDPTLTIGTTFQINITISNVENLYAWKMNLTWNPTLFEAANVQEGDFLRRGGNYQTTFNVVINNTLGQIHIDCSLSGEPPLAAVNGTGILAEILFEVLAGGETPLQLDTKLFDYYGTEIPHSPQHGSFNNIYHDIAIIAIQPSKNDVIVGETIMINVTVKNNGTMPESFEINVYYNYSLLGTSSLTNFGPSQTQVLTFQWNTSLTIPGIYNIKARASTVPGELETQNNELTLAGAVLVKESTSTGLNIPIETLAIAIFAVAAIACILLVLLKRKKTK
jgi:hypothetical protein